jgi:hypothetical protein
MTDNFSFLVTIDALLKCSDISAAETEKLQSCRRRYFDHSLSTQEREYVLALGRDKLDGGASGGPSAQSQQADDDFLATLDALILAPSLGQSEKEGLLLYRRQLLEGSLDQRDRAYVNDLARRLRVKPLYRVGPQRAARTEGQATIEQVGQRLRDAEERIETLRTKGKAVLRERDAAEAKVRELQGRLDAMAGAQPSGDGRSKFKRAKMEFARLYHPDNTKSDGIERLIRAEIFKEFWVVLERIERGS